MFKYRSLEGTNETRGHACRPQGVVAVIEGGDCGELPSGHQYTIW